MPLVSRTRATLRSAEFGFFGVLVYTRVQTPRRWGEPFSAGVLLLVIFELRPWRTSCWMVGTRYLMGFGQRTLEGYGPREQGTTRQTGVMRVAALLRGVNLGRRQVKMADLRAAVESLGHTNVETYLQSGNVVFTPEGSTTGLAAGLTKALGIEIAVVLRTGQE